MLHRIAYKNTWLSFQRLPHSLPFIRHHVPHGIVFLLMGPVVPNSDWQPGGNCLVRWHARRILLARAQTEWRIPEERLR